jgi:hypothetical protein
MVDCCLCPRHCCHCRCLHPHRGGAWWQNGGCRGHAQRRRAKDALPAVTSATTTPPYPPGPSPLADAPWPSRSSIVTKSRLQMAMWSGVHSLSPSLVRRRWCRNEAAANPAVAGPAAVAPAAACRGIARPRRRRRRRRLRAVVPAAAV